VGSIKHLPGAIWFDPDARTRAPGKDLLDVRLDNDWVISRTDWTPASTVVALRSGGPANHEHADRNSLIFKAHGERLFHDPFKAAYSPNHSRWLLRQTEAHTAVLVDGVGHQYHDGSEGTNASWAQANVTGYQAGDNTLQVTSDVTSAYRLLNEKITR
ncbi:MAG: heparinase II/III domain-containing protein, partial [Verrucomicrobiia bacterium]